MFYPYQLFFPALFISLTMLSFNLLGDGLRTLLILRCVNKGGNVMERILEVRNLRVSYHTYAGEVQSVRNISFHLNKGETLAIVGESGCGKTVTAKAIMRLIQEPPGEIKEGSEIIFNDKNILDMKEQELRQLRGADISMIFQDPMTSLNPTMKVGKQIAESLIIHRGMNKSEAFKEAVNILQLVNIPNAEKRLINILMNFRRNETKSYDSHSFSL